MNQWVFVATFSALCYGFHITDSAFHTTAIHEIYHEILRSNIQIQNINVTVYILREKINV